MSRKVIAELNMGGLHGDEQPHLDCLNTSVQHLSALVFKISTALPVESVSEGGFMSVCNSSSANYL